MNRVAIDFGVIQIYWYSIMIICGMLVGLLVCFREIRRQRINEDFFVNMTFYTIVWSVIGARLYYVLFNWEYYSNHLFDILKIWNGGLAIHGGILFGSLFVLYYTKRYKYSTLKIMDICAVGLIIGQAIGRWGNFFNQEAYGALTTRAELVSLKIPEFIIDGMFINGNYYQPTFLYESLWNFLGFILLLVIRGLSKYLKIGQLTGLYLAWYSIGRFVIEGMRQDSLMIGDWKMAQLVSVGLLVFGIFLFMRSFTKSRFDNLYKEEKINEGTF